jgi:biopolymer transport protein ExbB/TolQ
MELSGREELASLERYVGVIGTIGSTAPFIGLFGTVLGIIHAFGEMGGIGAAGPAAVADGIAEALVATAAGLFVAVPAVIAYNYFVRAAARNALELEARAAEFVAPILRSADKAEG